MDNLKEKLAHIPKWVWLAGGGIVVFVLVLKSRSSTTLVAPSQIPNTAGTVQQSQPPSSSQNSSGWLEAIKALSDQVADMSNTNVAALKAIGESSAKSSTELVKSNEQLISGLTSTFREVITDTTAQIGGIVAGGTVPGGSGGTTKAGDQVSKIVNQPQNDDVFRSDTAGHDWRVVDGNIFKDNRYIPVTGSNIGYIPPEVIDASRKQKAG